MIGIYELCLLLLYLVYNSDGLWLLNLKMCCGVAFGVCLYTEHRHFTEVSLFCQSCNRQLEISKGLILDFQPETGESRLKKLK